MLTTEDRDGIALVRIDHGKVNALDLELLGELTARFRELSDARAVVITGSGRAFCAGVDLKRFLAGGTGYAEAFFGAIDETFDAAFRLPVPLVAAVNGHAIAGGCVLAASADVVLMSDGTIGLPELSVGVPFPVIAVEIMRHRLGSRLAAVVHAARGLIPAQAQSAGIVDRVVETDALIDDALEQAGVFARTPRTTFAEIKATLRAPAVRAYADRPSPREVARLWSHPEVIAGIERVVGR